MSKRIEVTLWSIAFPGFGQILNRQLVKGALFILLEFMVNYKARINVAIIDSFYCNTVLAVKEIDYEWFMFYPCVYLFAMWDAYKNAEPQTPAFSYTPFVIAAYLGTIGVVYSQTLKIFGFLLGPIWLPIICIIIGLALGFVLRVTIIKYILTSNKN